MGELIYKTCKSPNNLNIRDLMVQQTTFLDFGPYVESLLYGAEHSSELSSFEDICTIAWSHPQRCIIEEILGHVFQDKHLLIKALTHRSIVSEVKRLELKSYERLEFLGDALLDLLVSEKLMSEFKTMREGELSKFRSTLVNEETLDEITSELGLDKFLILGKGERSSGGQSRASAKADIFESLLAAIYLDEGSENFNYLRVVFEKILKRYERSGARYFDSTRLDHFDPKTTLQEKTMSSLGILPQYETIEVNDGFHAEVALRGHLLAGAWATSKKKASKEAAKLALDVVENVITTIKNN